MEGNKLNKGGKKTHQRGQKNSSKGANKLNKGGKKTHQKGQINSTKGANKLKKGGKKTQQKGRKRENIEALYERLKKLPAYFCSNILE